MRTRTIKGSPERTASAAWQELAHMVRETLTAASELDEKEIDTALDDVAGVGRTLIAAGVLREQPVVLRALPLQLEMRVSMGKDALKGEEKLGKVPGAATATDWTLYLPDPEPYRSQVHAATDAHSRLAAGPAPAEPATASLSEHTAAHIDPDALRRISGASR